MDTTMDSLIALQLFDKQVIYVFPGTYLDSIKDT
jgi:hypothetical protein